MGAVHMSDALPDGFVLDQAAPEVVQASQGAPQGASAPVPAVDPTKPATASLGLPDGFALDAPHKPFTWRDTWPVKLAESAFNAAKLPGDVYGGRVDPLSDEGIKRATDLAGFATPAGPMFARAGAEAAAPPLLAAAGNIGVELPKAVASDSRITQQAGAVLSNIPIGSGPIRGAADKAIGQLGQAADTAAAMPAGEAISTEGAGATMRGALEGYIGPTSKAKVSQLYDKVGDLVDPTVRTDLEATRGVVSDIMAKRTAAGFDDPGKAINTVLGSVTTPDGLTYDGIKTARQRIGEMLKNPSLLPADMSQTEIKQIYGGLSQDLEAAVNNAGGDQAVAAFKRANTYNRLVNDRRESLVSILGNANRSDEGILNKVQQLAGSSATADANLLVQARRSVDPSDWNDVSSAIIGRLGRDQTGNFSPLRFVTDYGKLSDRGKTVLFRSTGNETLQPFLDDIATVSQRFKKLQGLANPSGTAQNTAGAVMLGGFGTAVGHAIATGAWGEPLTVAGTIFGTNLLSRALAQPATAAPVARWANAYFKVARGQTAQNVAAYMNQTKNTLAALTERLGRAMDGPIPSAAQSEDQGQSPYGQLSVGKRTAP